MSTKELVIITDAWYPQVNGVVTTYTNIISELPSGMFDKTTIIHPGLFKSIANPVYKETRISFCSMNRMMKMLYPFWIRGARFHIATEGVLGYQAKRVLRDFGCKHTSAYHTKFPEFIEEMLGIPTAWTRWYFDKFHRDSKIVMMSSQSVANRYPEWNCKVLGKGYEREFFYPRPDRKENKTPILLYVGRVSREKNIEEFLNIDLPFKHHKIVVGDGPIRLELGKKYPDVFFMGYKFGEELGDLYRRADVFVFPSRNDTYGIVVLEAMACGTPVAAFDVDGARDQIVNGINGYIGENLADNIERCLDLDREKVYNTVKDISWKNSANQFIKYLEEP
jgi:glycosyltransferase involved in cell wall biosynthesis